MAAVASRQLLGRYTCRSDLEVKYTLKLMSYCGSARKHEQRSTRVARKTKKHLSQLLGVSAVPNSYMRRFELVKSQYEIVVLHRSATGKRAGQTCNFSKTRQYGILCTSRKIAAARNRASHQHKQPHLCELAMTFFNYGSMNTRPRLTCNT